MTDLMSSIPLDRHPPSAVVEFGAARRDITPPVGIYARNWGAAKHDVAEGIHRPLFATAIAMRTPAGTEPLVLASLDLGWWQRAEDEWRIRGALIEELGLDPARVMIGCTHSHAGPSLCSEDANKPGGELIVPYLQTVRQAVLEATREAISRARPATLTWATGRCDLAVNRDLSAPDGSRVICGLNPGTDADDTLLVGRATDTEGKPIATIVNYACHLTTLAWDNRLISPDYVGAMREVVEQHTGGVPCAFLQGASGELAPGEQYTGDTGIADANGRRLGFAVLAALESMLPPRMRLCYDGVVESGASLAIWQRRPFEPSNTLAAEQIDVELPLKPMLSQAELRRQMETCTNRTLVERLRRKLRVVQMVGSGPTCSMPAWVWRVGDAVFVGQLNEPYSQFQLALRRRFPDHAVVVMNLVNGCCGYLSPPELHDQEVYQVWQSPFDRQALPSLIQTCQRAIADLIND